MSKILKKYKKEKVLLLGDRLETDIVFGKKLGIKTALVLTGASKEIEVKISNIKPDYIIRGV